MGFLSFKECDGIVSCLGHNLTLKGLYGHPRRLVTNAVSRLSESVIKNDSDNKVKFVLPLLYRIAKLSNKLIVPNFNLKLC